FRLLYSEQNRITCAAMKNTTFRSVDSAMDLASSIQCHSLAFLAVYSQILKLQTPAIMGGTMTFYRRPTSIGSEWYHSYAERDEGSAIRLSNTFTIPVIHDWFMYTPEVMGYFLENKIIQKILNERFNFKTWSDSGKNEMIEEWFPEIRKQKKTGYEHLRSLRIESDIVLKQSLIPILENALDGISLTNLQKQLFGDRNASH
ncbi:MAG: hypothetical protein WCR20_17600, partial [Verrucomicrobiota bacterium]